MIVRDPTRLACEPACVLLDLDDTLYEYAPCHDAGLSEARLTARRLLDLSGEDFDRLFSKARLEVKQRLGSIASGHSRLLYFQCMIEMAGLASQLGPALQLEQAYWRAFLDVSRIYDGALEFLDDLRIRRIPVAVVTDLTAQIQFRKMLYWRLDTLIEWIVTSEESGADKPGAASYRLALEKLGWKGGIVWMISDAIKDIAGLKAIIPAEAVGILKCSVPSSAAPEADAAFNSFDALRKRLTGAVEQSGVLQQRK